MLRAIVLCCSVAVLGTVGTASAQDWTKSKWGPNDEIGAANYMTPELVVKAASLVKTGKTYALGFPVDSKMPAYPPRAFKITVVQPGQAGIPGLGPSKTTYNDDIIEGWVGVGSQIDGLGHIGVEHVYYNGNKLLDFADPTGLKKLGIEKVPPMVTRGVLLDMAAHLRHRRGQGRHRLQRQGDRGSRQEAGRRNPPGRRRAVPHRLASLIGKDDKRFNAGEPGLGVEGAKYLTGKGVVAVGADTWGVEVIPFETKNMFEVHQILLPMNGTYILEVINTAELAKDKAYEFLFVLGQPRFKGGVQSMINPVAIR